MEERGRASREPGQPWEDEEEEDNRLNISVYKVFSDTVIFDWHISLKEKDR